MYAIEATRARGGAPSTRSRSIRSRGKRTNARLTRWRYFVTTVNLVDHLEGDGPHVAFVRAGTLHGTYCVFERVDSATWAVDFSPPFVDEKGMVDFATLSGDHSGPGSTLALFEDAELTFAPSELVPRILSQVTRGRLREPALIAPDAAPVGPYVNARTLVEHLAAALAAERADPWLLWNSNLPAEGRKLVTVARRSEADLQRVLDLLESVGLRVTVAPIRAVPDDPWAAFA